jgi:predicted nucleotidyltransferase
MSLFAIFTRLDHFFNREQIPYAVIGGSAVAVWGEIRATQDIDLLCSVADIKRITDSLTREGLKFEHRTGDSDDPISDVVRIDLGDALPSCEVDILGIRGAPAGILERRIRIQVQGHSVPVVAAEDLIVLKLLAGSARDLEDARKIVHLRRERIDRLLLRRLCPSELNAALDALLAGYDE